VYVAYILGLVPIVGVWLGNKVGGKTDNGKSSVAYEYTLSRERDMRWGTISSQTNLHRIVHYYLVKSAFTVSFVYYYLVLLPHFAQIRIAYCAAYCTIPLPNKYPIYFVTIMLGGHSERWSVGSLPCPKAHADFQRTLAPLAHNAFDMTCLSPGVIWLLLTGEDSSVP